jgi:hypothetical protein
MAQLKVSGRKTSERPARSVSSRGGFRSSRKGTAKNSVKGRYGQQRAAGYPLELLAQQRSVGPFVAAHEQQRSQHVKEGVVGGADLVKPMLQQAGCLTGLDGPQPQPQQAHAGCVDHRQKPAAAEPLETLFRKAQGKMQEECRLQCLSRDIQPIYSPVQVALPTGFSEHPRVLQGEKAERDQAKEVEMRGPRRAPTAEKDVDADGKIDQADDSLRLGEAPVEGFGDDDDGRVKGNAVPGNGVDSFLVDLGAIEDVLQIGKMDDGVFGETLAVGCFGLSRGLGRERLFRNSLVRNRLVLNGLLGAEQVWSRHGGALRGAAGQSGCGSEQVALLNARALPWTVG